MSGPPVARTREGDGANSLSPSQTALLVAALVTSVISFQLNATMLGPAIHDIDTQLGPGAFASMSSYFYLSGAIANVVFIRWSDFIGRKRVLLGIMVALCIGTVLCIVSTSLPVVLLGRVLQGGCNVTFGVGSSLGFAWAGPIVGQGSVEGFQSALWISVAIGIVALGMSLVLKPRRVEAVPAATGFSH